MPLICSACSHANPEDGRFCQKCGSPLSSRDRSTKFEHDDRYQSDPSQSGYSKSGYYGNNGYGAASDYAPRSSPTGMLVWSILATVLCCQPAGIVAIVFTALAMNADGQGNHAQADRHLKTAKTWAWVAFGIGFVVYAIYIIFVVIAGVAGP